MTRHLAIGDIHGCFDALYNLCEYVQLRQDDVIVTLGDYCDRGPDSRSVIEWLLKLDHFHTLNPLRGNHELIMLAARENPSEVQSWIKSGGRETLASYATDVEDEPVLDDIPETHWRFLSNRLLPYYECDSHFFVHANAYPDLELAEQPDYMLYWERYNNPARHTSGKIMVSGHSRQTSGLPVTNGHAICIDTWAYGDGWLTCLHVESGQIWQCNQKGQRRKFWLDEVADNDPDR
jgi:serine/threonine protein phosphatase 1